MKQWQTSKRMVAGTFGRRVAFMIYSVIVNNYLVQPIRLPRDYFYKEVGETRIGEVSHQAVVKKLARLYMQSWRFQGYRVTPG